MITLKDFLIELSYWNLLAYGAGLKFLVNVNNKYSGLNHFDIEKYVSSSHQVPLVIFPEVLLI